MSLISIASFATGLPRGRFALHSSWWATGQVQLCSTALPLGSWSKPWEWTLDPFPEVPKRIPIRQTQRQQSDLNRFQAELHIVHYKSSYGSFAEAVKHSDGLAVLAILIELERRDNTAFRHIVEQFPEIQTEGLETNLLSPIPLADLLPDNVLNFYRYNGSLTTPGCEEIVIWTVFNTPIAISEHQVSFDVRYNTETANYQGFHSLPDSGSCLTLIGTSWKTTSGRSTWNTDVLWPTGQRMACHLNLPFHPRSVCQPIHNQDLWKSRHIIVPFNKSEGYKKRQS